MTEAPKICPGCGKPYESPDFDPRCSGCAESCAEPIPAQLGVPPLPNKISRVVEFKSDPEGYVDYVIRLSHETRDDRGFIYSVECEVWKVCDWGDESGSSEDCWQVDDSKFQEYTKHQQGLPPGEPSANLDAHDPSWSVHLKWDGCSNWVHNEDHYCSGFRELLAAQAVTRQCFLLAIEAMGPCYEGG